jgi:hypothetical protein
VYEVEIIEFDSTVSVKQGETVETAVKVNNTGNQDLAVIMSAVLELENLTINTTPQSQSVEDGKTAEYIVRISTTEDVKVGKYTGKFKATTSSVAKSEKEFTLVVNPLPETITEIEKDYQNMTSIVNALIAEFNAAKGQLSGDNLTALDTKMNETQTLFNSLKTAINNDDYVDAAMYIQELNGLVSSTRDLMDELGIGGMGGAFWNALIIWIIVAVVCIGAVGLLIYMMVPAKGYTMGKGYAPKGKGSISDKLNNVVRSLRGAMPGGKPKSAGQIVSKYKPAYSSGGYNKLPRYATQQTGNLADRMRTKLKRK